MYASQIPVHTFLVEGGKCWRKGGWWPATTDDTPQRAALATMSGCCCYSRNSDITPLFPVQWVITPPGRRVIREFASRTETGFDPETLQNYRLKPRGRQRRGRPRCMDHGPQVIDIIHNKMKQHGNDSAALQITNICSLILLWFS